MLWKLLAVSFALFASKKYTSVKDAKPIIPSEVIKSNITNHEKWDRIEEYIRTHKPFPFIVDM